MGFEVDPKVKAAKEWLQSRLEEVFDHTLAHCKNTLWKFDYPLLLGEGREGDFLVLTEIESWENQLRESISDGFELFLNAARESQEDARNAPGEMAQKLTWETIAQTFGWAPEGRNNSTKFSVEEWLSRAAYPEPEVAEGRTPREHGWQAQTADRLNRDFRTRFERLLNQLRDKAFVNAPTARSTNLPTERTHKPQPEMLTFQRLPKGGVPHRSHFRTSHC